MIPPISLWRMVIIMTLFTVLGSRGVGMLFTRLVLGVPMGAMQEILIGFGLLASFGAIIAMGIAIAKQPLE